MILFFLLELSPTMHLFLFYGTEVATRLSHKCSEQLVADHALGVIFQIVRNCNRGLPSIELIQVAISVLINISRVSVETSCCHVVVSWALSLCFHGCEMSLLSEHLCPRLLNCGHLVYVPSIVKFLLLSVEMFLSFLVRYPKFSLSDLIEISRSPDQG